MRRRRALALGLVLLLVAAACTDAKRPGGNASASAIDQPRAGGTLRLGIERPKSLDPAQVSRRSPSELLVADLLFDGLTSMDDGATTAHSAIAKSWTSTPDLKSWTFVLRDDAHFSNGRAIQAADVKYSLERVAKLGETSLAALRIDHISGMAAFTTGGAPELSGVRVIDPHTVAIDIDGQMAGLPELLAAPEYGIVPKEAVEAPSPAFASAPVGSGPFSLAGVQGDVVKLVKSGQGSAHLDGIELHEYDTANLGKAYDDFVADQLDWTVVPNDRAEDAAERFGADGFRPFDAELFYAFNLFDPAFADLRFRQAIVKAIDRTAIVKAVYAGIADPLGALVPSGIAGHVDDPCGDPCKFDIDAAKALIAQAYPNGGVPSFNIDYVPGTGEDAVANTIVADLAAVGITAVPRAHTPDEYPTFAVSGQEQLFRIGSIGLDPSPDSYLTPLFLSGSRDNVTGFSDPNVDNLLLVARGTADPTHRRELYQQAETLIFAHSPIVPIAQFHTNSVASSRVHDLKVAIDGTFAGDEVWLG